MTTAPDGAERSTWRGRAARLTATSAGQAGWMLPAAAVPLVWAALFDHGVYWPDEIYQGLEQAHRFAFGYGFVPWEYQVGARTWILPGAIGLLWTLASAAGVDDSLVLVSLAKLAMAALSVAGVFGAMRLAERLAPEGDGPAASLLAGALAATFPLSIVVGSKPLGEVANAPLVVFAALLLTVPAGRETAGRARSFASGVLVAVAILLRFQTVLVAPFLAAWPLAGRRRGDFLLHAAGGATGLAAGAAIDLAVWGSPWHTPATYLSFHLVRSVPGIAGEWDFAPLPATYYLTSTWTSAGIASLFIAAGLLLSARRAPWALAAAAAFVVFHCAMLQKEFRYLMTIVPLTLSLAGVGLAIASRRIAERLARPPLGAAALLALFLAWTLGWKAAGVSFGELGHYLDTPLARARPWHHHEEINRLLHAAGERDDLCGLAMSAGENMVWNGGYTYLHRDVPVLGVWDRPELHGHPLVVEAANYALVPPGVALPPVFRPVLSGRKAALFRRAGECVPHPELDFREMERPPGL